jgi:hypothetical protein
VQAPARLTAQPLPVQPSRFHAVIDKKKAKVAVRAYSETAA